MYQSSTTDLCRLSGQFEDLRKKLLEPDISDRLDKPLAYWARQGDRRLPLAFLGRTVRELLAVSFHDLRATPGIGQKKSEALLLLLERATSQPPTLPTATAAVGQPSFLDAPLDSDGQFDASLVSDSLWSTWCDTVIRHRLIHETLGRVAPSLFPLPTVIWHKTLGDYADMPLAEVRALKVHGEKRVRVILEVFYIVHQMLAQAGAHSRLSIRIVPSFVPAVESWVTDVCRRPNPPNLDAVRENLLRPLLEQVRTDAGPAVHELAEGRLGVNVPHESVNAQARRLDVTRARIYQQLDQCGQVMEVRWPEGRWYFARLLERLADCESLALVGAIGELFYPTKNETVAEENALLV